MAENKKYLDMPGLTYFYNQIKSKFASKTDVGTPSTASTIAAMTDHDKVYVYTGSETGHTFGDWYFYEDGSWHSGGQYRANVYETDKTLSVADKPADGKKTGDEIADLKSAFDKQDPLGLYPSVDNSPLWLSNGEVNGVLTKKSDHYKYVDQHSSGWQDTIENYELPSNNEQLYLAVWCRKSSNLDFTEEDNFTYSIKFDGGGNTLVITDASISNVNIYSNGSAIYGAAVLDNDPSNQKRKAIGSKQKKSFPFIKINANNNAIGYSEYYPIEIPSWATSLTITASINSDSLKIAVSVLTLISPVRFDILNLETGLSYKARVALLACFRNVVWKSANAQTFYETLQKALIDEDITEVVALFDQSSFVISETDVLDDVIPFLSVYAVRNDGTRSIVDSNSYILSGNLESGQSNITVTYMGVDAVFSVDVSTVPSGYTLKNYIVADGTQYIDTNIPETDAENWWFRLKEQRTGYENRNGHVFSSSNFFTPYLFSSGSAESTRINMARFGGNVTNYGNGIWEINTDYTIQSFKNDDKVYLNGTAVYEGTKGSTMNSANTFALLAYKQAADSFPERFRFIGRLYYLKTFDSENRKTHDFTPCINSSGVCGLYDLVTNIFYPPTQGTIIGG